MADQAIEGLRVPGEGLDQEGGKVERLTEAVGFPEKTTLPSPARRTWYCAPGENFAALS